MECVKWQNYHPPTCCILFHAIYPIDNKIGKYLISCEFIRGSLRLEIHSFSFNSTVLCGGKKWRKLFSQQAFKQYPAASKHTPTILHTTHFWSHPVYPLSHINWLSQISVTSRCFAQTLLRYLHFEFPLICSILRVCIVLKPYVSAAHKKRKQAVAPKEASLYRMHAELSFVCKTTLSNRLNASSHRLPPTKSASFIV